MLTNRSRWSHGGEATLGLRAKIVKSNGEKPVDFESGISQPLLELEVNTASRPSWGGECNGGQGNEVGGGWEAFVIFVCIPQLNSSQKVQVHELEKNFIQWEARWFYCSKNLPKSIQKSQIKKRKANGSPGAARWPQCMMGSRRTWFSQVTLWARESSWNWMVVGLRRFIWINQNRTMWNSWLTLLVSKLLGKDVNFESLEFQL